MTVQQGGNSRNVANNRSTEADVIKQGRNVSLQPVGQGEFPVGVPLQPPSCRVIVNCLGGQKDNRLLGRRNITHTKEEKQESEQQVQHYPSPVWLSIG